MQNNLSLKPKQNRPIYKRVLRIRFVNLNVQSEGSSAAFSEVTGRYIISSSGLCSMQGSVLQS